MSALLLGKLNILAEGFLLDFTLESSSESFTSPISCLVSSSCSVILVTSALLIFSKISMGASFILFLR